MSIAQFWKIKDKFWKKLTWSFAYHADIKFSPSNIEIQVMAQPHHFENTQIKCGEHHKKLLT